MPGSLGLVLAAALAPAMPGPPRAEAEEPEVAATLDRAFGDADAPAGENAFTGLLPLLNLEGLPAWAPAVRERLGLPVEEPGASTPLGFRLSPWARREGRAVDAALEEAFWRAQAAPWAAGEFPAVAAWLDAIDPALDAAAAALDRSSWFVPLVLERPEEPVQHVLRPHLAGTRALGRALVARGMRRMRAGDAAGAVEDLETLGRLARLPTREPTPISSLVGISVGSLSRALFEAVLSDPGFDAGLAAAVAGARAERPAAVLMERLIGEASLAVALDLWRRAAAGDALVGDAAGPPEGGGGIEGDPLTRAIRSPRIDQDAALRRIEGLWETWFMDLPEAQAQREAIRTGFENQASAWFQEHAPLVEALADGEEPPGAGDAASRGSAVAEFYVALSGAGLLLYPEAERIAETYEDAQAVALAVEAFRRGTGRLPGSLAELVPWHLDAVPADRFGGGPLRYAVRGSGPGYTIWSVGPDGEDDGGADDPAEGDLAVTVTR